MDVELIGEWNAVHDRMPGRPPTLSLTGRCRFPTPRWTWNFQRHVPQGINPEILMLDLIVTPPAPLPTEDPIEDVEVSWSEETDDKYTQMHVLVEGAEGKVVDVQEVS